MTRKLSILVIFFSLLIPARSLAQADKNQDIWAPFKFFVGKWEGRGEGKPGISTGKQEFQFILGGKYLHVKNEARFEPQRNNPAGQIHEDWGFFSYDQARKKYVLRQFHMEGFVNQYLCESCGEDGKTFTFVSEQIENIPAGWRAKLTYKILNENEFQQSFDLAAPEKEYDCYSVGIMKRLK